MASLFTESYKDLLILQYRNLPNAEQTVEALIAKYEELYNVLISFETEFDIDTAQGVQLDIIGKIVGINRIVPLVIPKNYFGFDDNTIQSFPMGDKFQTVVAYPFKSRFEANYTSSELNDFDYRLFIKAKVLKNNINAYMIDEDTKLSLQNAIDFLFGTAAYIIDNQNMSLSIFINESFDFDKISFIKALDLIPRPQGVFLQYVQYEENNTFGFADNPNSLSWGDKFGDYINGGSAFTSYTDDIDGGDAFSTFTDDIDGGDAFTVLEPDNTGGIFAIKI